MGCFKRTASTHVCYLGWNSSPAQVGCMRQVLGPGALGRPRGIGRRGRWEGGSGWRTHVNPWLIHFNVWQKPLKYCKVISLQLIKKKNSALWIDSVKIITVNWECRNKKKEREKRQSFCQSHSIFKCYFSDKRNTFILNLIVSLIKICHRFQVQHIWSRKLWWFVNYVVSNESFWFWNNPQCS